MVMLYNELGVEDLPRLEATGNWVGQTKVDGDNFTIVHKNLIANNHKLYIMKLVNRHGNDYTRQFPEIANGIGLKKEVNCVLNGEIAYWDNEKQIFDFNRFRGRQGLENSTEIMRRRLAFPCKFYVFDLIEYEGINMYNNPSYPFEKRYEILSRIITNNNTTQLLPIRSDLRAFFEEEVKAGREGIMVKNIKNIYIEGRTDSVLKCKNWKYSTIKFNGFEQNNAGITLTNPDGDRVLVAGQKAELVKATIIQSGYTMEVIRHLQDRTENGRLREGTHYAHITTKDINSETTLITK